MKLSHSGIDRLKQCPRSYQLHYQEKLRPITLSSALLFGGALDEALNELITNRDLRIAKQKFTEEWNKTEGKSISYYKSDLDLTLLSESDCKFLDTITDNVVRVSTANWFSMRAKGLLMLDVYFTELLPKIKKVITVQKSFELEGIDADGNPSGDFIVGIEDLKAVIEMELPDGGTQEVLAVVDNKSTSAPYSKNSLDKKSQTALYCVAEELEYAAFFTVNKKNFKTQAIIGKPPESLKEEVVQDFVNAFEYIKKGDFPQNDKKNCFSYGSRCDFYNYCWDNKNMSGLKIKQEGER